MKEENTESPKSQEVSPPPTEEQPQDTGPPWLPCFEVRIGAGLSGGYATRIELQRGDCLLRADAAIEPVLAAAAEALTGRAVKTLLVEFADEPEEPQTECTVEITPALPADLICEAKEPERGPDPA